MGEEEMKRMLFYCCTLVFFCCWFFGTATNSHADDLQFDAAFTIRDTTPLNGIPDEIDEGEDGFWGFVTNSNSQYDEFFLEFPLSSLLQPVGSAIFYFFFSESTPDLSIGGSIDLNLAVYEGDGAPNMDKFGIGDPLDPVTVANIEQNVFSVDVTGYVNEFINSGVSHLGIRLYEPFSNTSQTGRPAQLIFERGFLSIVAATTTDLKDTLHPAGAVHAQPILQWHPFYKMLKLKLHGYVLDELSIAKDGGIGISQAYLEVNGRKIILLGEDRKGQPVNLLDDAGGFDLVTYLKPNKSGVYEIKLYAADTNAEAPNFGLVDSSSAYLAYRTPTKDEDTKMRKR
jgi:hypothetical protein